MNPDWVAFHEAGHAVVSVVLLSPITRASIVRDEADGSIGHVDHRTRGAKFASDVESNVTLRVRERLEAGIMVSLAGDLALRRYLGDAALPPGSMGDDHDQHSAVEYASRVCDDPGEITAYLTWLGLRTAGLLRVPWNWMAVERVAAALMEHKVLSGRKVRQIVRQASDDYYEARRRQSARPSANADA